MKISPTVRSGLRVGPRFASGVQKVLSTSSAPAFFTYEESDRFIDYVKKESVLFDMATVVRMTKDRKRIAELYFGDGFLDEGHCGSCPETLDLRLRERWLEVKDIKGTAIVCDNFLEDNLEGEDVTEHLVTMLSKQAANELEMFALMGSTAGIYQPAGYRTGLLGLIDGWYVDGVTNGHVLDATQSPEGRCITGCKLKEMIQALPPKYRQGKRSELVFIMAENLAEDYIAWLWSQSGGGGTGNIRLGADRAFAYVESQVPLGYGGIPIQRVPLLPMDMDNCVAGSLGDSDGTFVILTTKKNPVVAIHREVRYERERKGCEEQTYHMLTLRADAKWANPDAVVIYDCLAQCDCS